jgi:hypothetical protein
MTAPFIVFSLPRSRSAWVARFLSYGGKRCGHDLATECGSLAELTGRLHGEYAGTAETGAVVGWRALLRRIPNARIAVIRRPVREIYDSLSHFGLGSSALMDELIDRDAMLDELAKVHGVKSFTFAGLNTIDSCRDLFEHCLGIPFDWEWWESLAGVNIQVDVAERLRFLEANRSRIEAIKREAIEDGRASHVVLEAEAWNAVWPEIDALFAEHFGEVEGDLAENRPYKLDEPLMRAMHAAGQLRIFTARVDGILAGYCMWQVTSDVESAGMLIAQHGPWFVRKSYAHLMLGPKLFDASLDDLRKIGVKNAFPHHRLQGRGAKLGAFFRRRGAVETQRTYSLWLGEPQHA